MIRLLTLTAAFLAVGVAACGPGAPDGPPPDLGVARAGALGEVVADAQGRTLYRFHRDSPSPSATNCAGACAIRWPPALAGSAAPTTRGIDARLAGVLVRPDGARQLTLAGWPLYRYLDDTARGQVNGHGVEGTWFAVTPAGARATETTRSPAGDGGYGY